MELRSAALQAARATEALSWPRSLSRPARWLAPSDVQLRRLRKTIARAAAAPYYAELFRKAGVDPWSFTYEDLRRLPLLEKSTMAQHGLDSFMTVEREGLVAVQTSGSTGTPCRFYRSWVEETAYSARWLRVYAAYGCRPWDAQVNIAITDKPDRKGPVKLLRRAGFLPRIAKLGSDTPPAQVLARVQELNPPILSGYAGAIEALADHVLTTRATIRPPRAVFCTAMEVTERCLDLAEQAFHAPAVDVYVTNEFGVIAWSCPRRRDALHVNDDALIVEVLGPDGSPVAPGTVGELVITSLGLVSMPLIRYRMGDMAARLPGTCECGSSFGLMSRVQGRTAHVIRRPNGAPIMTPFVTSLFGRVNAHEWVRRFQVREEPGQALRFLLNPRQEPTESQRAALTQSVRSALGGDFSVTFEYVDEIPPAPTGKFQYLVPLKR